jgi:hypothetical protein
MEGYIHHFNPEHGGRILIRNVGISSARAEKANIDLYHGAFSRR